jgi:sugar O-acyltransferase (sialic acid O-acetyltransferase NeuD family)
MTVMGRKPLLLFPCNGNAVEAIDCIGDGWECIGFVDDSLAKQGTTVFGLPVFARSVLDEILEAKVLAVPGSPSSYSRRREFIDSLKLTCDRFATIIHPAADVSRNASVGFNTLLMAGAVLTSNASVGNHCCILPNTVIHHDAVVGDWSLVGSNVTLAGGVRLGLNCYIGSGTSVMNGVQIGDGVLAGLGSNIVRDVEAGTRVAGNPAKPIVEKV